MPARLFFFVFHGRVFNNEILPHSVTDSLRPELPRSETAPCDPIHAPSLSVCLQCHPGCNGKAVRTALACPLRFPLHERRRSFVEDLVSHLGLLSATIKMPIRCSDDPLGTEIARAKPFISADGVARNSATLGRGAETPPNPVLNPSCACTSMFLQYHHCSIASFHCCC